MGRPHRRRHRDGCRVRPRAVAFQPGRERGGRLPKLRTHEQQVEARAEEYTKRFLADAADQLVRALPGLDVASIVIAHAPGTLEAFVEALPAQVRDRVGATVEAQITGEDAPAVAERLADTIAEVTRERDGKVAADALAQAAMTDGRGEIGGAAVLRALAEQRVEHLVVVPGLELARADVTPEARTFLGDLADDLLLERAFEQAAETGANVTVVDHPGLAAEGGIAALTLW
nr:host attachment protein [Propioniciclava sp.]